MIDRQIVLDLPTNSTLMTHSTPITAQTDFKFDKAVILGKGAPNYPWAKCLLSDGEQAFVYPDDEETVNPKTLPVGSTLFITPPRLCRKPGTTKWTVNALHFDLQSEDIQAFVAKVQPEQPVKTEQCELPVKSPIDIEDCPTKKVSISMQHSYARQMFVDRVVHHFGLTGPKRRAEALGIIVDLYMATNQLEDVERLN